VERDSSTTATAVTPSPPESMSCCSVAIVSMSTGNEFSHLEFSGRSMELSRSSLNLGLMWPGRPRSDSTFRYCSTLFSRSLRRLTALSVSTAEKAETLEGRAMIVQLFRRGLTARRRCSLVYLPCKSHMGEVRRTVKQSQHPIYNDGIKIRTFAFLAQISIEKTHH
jgi:hypothetical protein